MAREVQIKGAHGGRVDLREGERLTIVNVEGAQILDFFAFAADRPSEALSTAHIRATLRRVTLRPGDVLVSSRRRAMLRLVEDTVGVNDLCIAACDPERYSQDFGVHGHRSCRDNLAEQTADLGLAYEQLPDPINFFQNTPVLPDGAIGGGRSPAGPGDRIVLDALMGLIVVGSACPQDLTDANGGRPTDILLRVEP